MRKYLEKEFYKQVTYLTGRKPYIHESVIAWFQMKSFSDEQVLAGLLEANRLVYAKKTYL